MAGHPIFRMPLLCPSVNFPSGHNRAVSMERTGCDPSLGSPLGVLRGQGERAGTMEASDKGLSAGVTTNYLRLTDAAIRAVTLPPECRSTISTTQSSLGWRSGCALLAAGLGSTCSPSLGRGGRNARRWVHGPSSTRRQRARPPPSPLARWSRGRSERRQARGQAATTGREGVHNPGEPNH